MWGFSALCFLFWFFLCFSPLCRVFLVCPGVLMYVRASLFRSFFGLYFAWSSRGLFLGRVDVGFVVVFAILGCLFGRFGLDVCVTMGSVIFVRAPFFRVFVFCVLLSCSVLFFWLFLSSCCLVLLVLGVCCWIRTGLIFCLYYRFRRAGFFSFFIPFCSWLLSRVDV